MCCTNYSRQDDFPSEELQALNERQGKLPRAIPTILILPTGCGALLNFQLVGIFPTARWLTDPTMPADVKEMFGGTPFFALGEYRVAHVDIKDAKGNVRSLTLVVNSGVEGMNTGFWGGAFEREAPHLCLARFEGADLGETSIVQKPIEWYIEYEGLEFVGSFGTTQLEQLLGVAVDFLLSQADWNGLPQTMIEFRDMSPRAERKERARQRTPQSKAAGKFTFE